MYGQVKVLPSGNSIEATHIDKSSPEIPLGNSGELNFTVNTQLIPG